VLSEKVPGAVILALFGVGLLVMVVLEFATPPVGWLNVLFGAVVLPVVIIGSYAWLAWLVRRLGGAQ
jgi:hypothetical protein